MTTLLRRNESSDLREGCQPIRLNRYRMSRGNYRLALVDEDNVETSSSHGQRAEGTRRTSSHHHHVALGHSLWPWFVRGLGRYKKIPKGRFDRLSL